MNVHVIVVLSNNKSIKYIENENTPQIIVYIKIGLAFFLLYF